MHLPESLSLTYPQRDSCFYFLCQRFGLGQAGAHSVRAPQPSCCLVSPGSGADLPAVMVLGFSLGAQAWPGRCGGGPAHRRGRGPEASHGARSLPVLSAGEEILHIASRGVLYSLIVIQLRLECFM